MNQQHLQAYINLIQQLLTCPSGEEWILLRQNEALVNPELVQVMEQVATQLAHQGNLKESKFLHNLAGQIHHLFVAQTVQPLGTEDNSQAYLELIKALLDCPQGSEKELLEAHQDLIGPGLVQMMQQVAVQLAANGDQDTANYLQHWATELNRLWLQQHGFQPVSKPDLELKHPTYPPVTQPATQFTPPQINVPPPAPVPQPNSPPTLENEDVWADGPEESNQLPLHPLPAPQILSEPPEPVSIPKMAAALSSPDWAFYAQINQSLGTIAGALTKLSEALTPPVQAPSNPLWYMEVLERAHSEHWILTSEEIQQLIGVKPTCSKGSESFQRGCWIFVKAGRLGTQTGWLVKKDNASAG